MRAGATKVESEVETSLIEQGMAAPAVSTTRRKRTVPGIVMGWASGRAPVTVAGGRSLGGTSTTMESGNPGASARGA